ncbi:hypothetical protein U9M48_043859 [Paspalum notatum var. saurae]|uniref:Uncharacterized protein n=1 Tax=Paspalum notatum var. saurae TaxID=547442 RepID=A0AAQ3V040_PASNO
MHRWHKNFAVESMRDRGGGHAPTPASLRPEPAFLVSLSSLVKKELVTRSLSPSISITWGCSKHFLHSRY